jgi:hypothetical protein
LLLAKHHLIVAHEVTNDGVDRDQLSSIASHFGRCGRSLPRGGPGSCLWRSPAIHVNFRSAEVDPVYFPQIEVIID